MKFNEYDESETLLFIFDIYQGLIIYTFKND
jgi:hypothetical protein